MMPACASCRHWQPRLDDYRRCAAFPERIPDGIWLEFRSHRRAIEGDRGIRFAPYPASPRATAEQGRQREEKEE